jgi:hypothetical protein
MTAPDPLLCATCANPGPPSPEPTAVTVVDGKPICQTHLDARTAITKVGGAFHAGAH